MLQTPPDIATRSQSAGRSVNPPPPPWQAPAQLERSLPPPEHPGAGGGGVGEWGWQLPPSWGQPLRWGPHPLPPQGASQTEGWASGVSFGLSAQQIGEMPAFLCGFLGSSSLFMEAEVLGCRGPSSRCQQMPAGGMAAPQPLPTSPEQGTPVYSGELPEQPWTACPWEWKAAWLGPAGGTVLWSGFAV